MAIDSHPMNLGEILGRTLRIYRNNFLHFAGIAALLMAGLFGLAESLAVHWNFYTSLSYYDICSLLLCIALPAFVQLTSSSVFNKQMRISVATRFAYERWRSYFWVALLEQFGGLIVPEIFGIGLTFGMHFFCSEARSNCTRTYISRGPVRLSANPD